MTVEHNAGISLDKEFILVGQEIQTTEDPGSSQSDSDTDNLAYTLQTMKSPSDVDVSRRVSVHEVGQNIYVATTKFSRPFDYRCVV